LSPLGEKKGKKGKRKKEKGKRKKEVSLIKLNETVAVVNGRFEKTGL
jgi:hypothetical protein